MVSLRDPFERVNLLKLSKIRHFKFANGNISSRFTFVVKITG